MRMDKKKKHSKKKKSVQFGQRLLEDLVKHTCTRHYKTVTFVPETF